MPDIRRCAIYGCKSNSRENMTLKFFNFPSRDNPLYEIWLSNCPESESIRMQRRPYICSKHFHEKEIGFRRLATGAVPALFLIPPPGFAEEESARLAEQAAAQAEKLRQAKLINDVVFEWCKRAHHYAETSPLCTTRRELRKIAIEVRNLVGATLTFRIDDYWLRKFRRSYHIEFLDFDESRNKTLDLVSIINEVDPEVRILSDEEIEVLVKEETVMLCEMEEKRRVAKSKKKYDSEDSSGFDKSMKKHKRKKGSSKMSNKNYEESVGDYSYFSSSMDHTFDDGGDEKSENKSGSSIVLSDDDDFDGYNRPRHSQLSEESDVVIRTYAEALQHIKPLEDFALRQENYRAIGLLSTLEIIFKTPKLEYS